MDRPLVSVDPGLILWRAFFFLFFFLQELTTITSRKNRWVCHARGWCVRRGSLLQDCLPVKFQDVKFKFKHEFFCENRHEASILLKLFHNLFAINFFLSKIKLRPSIEIEWSLNFRTSTPTLYMENKMAEA